MSRRRSMRKTKELINSATYVELSESDVPTSSSSPDRLPRRRSSRKRSHSSKTVAKNSGGRKDTRKKSNPVDVAKIDTTDAGPSSRQDLFDKLLSPDLEPPLLLRQTSIKKYANKNRKSEPEEGRILNFVDNSNRDKILEWLNDNRNCFDRLTHTQKEPTLLDAAGDSADTTLDLPSVSQIHVKKKHVGPVIRRSKRLVTKPVRTRSLGTASNEKNGQDGRIKRHSVAGDSLEYENYNIEEICSENEEENIDPVVLKRNAKQLINLMEDEYLKTVEKELEQQIINREEDRRHSGWERVNQIKKQIVPRKKMKKLNISVSPPSASNPYTKETTQNFPVYDLGVLEEFFVDKMSTLLKESGNGNEFVVENMRPDNIMNLVTYLKNLDASARTILRSSLLPVFEELKVICTTKPELSDAESQTDSIVPGSTSIKKLSPQKINTEVQTIPGLPPRNTGIQTDSPPMLIESGTQTVELENADISVKKESSKICSQPSEFQCLKASQKSPEKQEGEYHLDNSLDDLCFETEDLLAGVKTIPEVPKSGSVLAISIEPSNNKIAENPSKRCRGSSPELPEYTSNFKRPCNRFIDSDLSIAFESCTEGFGDQKSFHVFSQNSEERALNEHMLAMVEKFEEKITVASPHSAQKSKSISYEFPLTNQNFLDSGGSSKLGKNVSWDHTLKPGDFGKENSPKKPRAMNSRRSLFETSKTDKCSESLFDEENEDKYLPIRPLEDPSMDLDTLLAVLENNKSEKVDKEVENIMSQADDKKVKVLQHVVLKPQGVDSDTDSEGTDDLDIIEATQQKDSPKSNKSFLDVTLPPPIEFQDCSSVPVAKTEERRPLADLTQNKRSSKITSTPCTQRGATQQFLSLSPIPKISQKAASKKPRILGSLELAQKAKFSPLTIVKRSDTINSKNSSLNSSSASKPQQKSILNYMNRALNASPTEVQETRKPCITSTRLNKEQLMMVVKLANKGLASYTSSFSPNVTHLVLNCNERQCAQDHTMKYVNAVAAGIWVVKLEWVQQCLQQNKIIPEEPFEALDVSGEPGPMSSRLAGVPRKLLKNFKICAAGPFQTTSKKEVERVVQILGGRTVPTPEDLLDDRNNHCLIVSEINASQDTEIYDTWLEVLRVVTVEIEWLSRSVGQYNLLSLRPFCLCSEDSIEDLGYPGQLLVKTPFSFTQNTYSTINNSA